MLFHFRYALRLTLELALVLAVVARCPKVTLAHAELESATPAANSEVSTLPARLTLVFAEEVRPGSAVVEVTGPDGARVDTGDAAVDLTNPQRDTVTVSLFAGGAGTYAVHWENVSNLDGDPESGDYTFTVSAAGESSPAVISASGPTAVATEDPAYGNPLNKDSNFDSRAFAISVGAGLLALIAIVAFWFTVRPRNPRFGPRAGRHQE